MRREHQKPGKKSSTETRARRKPSKEWEKWHAKLVQLYQEDSRSRKDIIEVMKRDHEFVITDKQLKYHFQTSGVTKKVSDQDMGIMVALRIQHEAAGQPVRFVYKNHDISASRINQASKNWKGPLSSISEIPSYLKVIPDSSSDVPSTYLDAPENQIIGNDGDGVSGKKFDNGKAFDVTPGCRPNDDSANAFEIGWIPQDVSYYDMDRNDLNSFDSDAIYSSAPDVSRWAGTYPNPDASQAITLTPSFDGFELNQPFSSFHDRVSTAQSSRGSSVCKVDLDWSNFLNVSSRLSAFAILEPATETYSKVGSPARTSTATLGYIAPERLDDRDDDASERNKYSPEPYENTEHGKPSFSANIDAEAIIWPLQLMRGHLQTFSDHSRFQWHFSNGSSLTNLHTLVKSRWLTIEIENLLHWSYEASVKSSLRRKHSRAKEGLDFDLEDRLAHAADSVEGTEPQDQPGGQDAISADKRTKFTSYWLSLVPAGALSIRLKTETKNTSTGCSARSPLILSISSMPKTTNRTKGISARFIFPAANDARSRIPPHITTFNLVSEGSPIIQYISSGDLQSVKRIFSCGEASPRDVDPWGFSLLSYAMYTGCSSVFRLLLECGVGLQNCERFGNALDAIWAIWSYFVVFNSYDHNNKDFGGSLRNFDECVAMTDMVLRYGCDIKDTVGYSAKANALFEMCYYWPMEQAHPSMPAKALDYLIGIGYELEQSNQEGQTPLLWTASAYQPQVIKCLKVFIERKASIHATDGDGRGVLHCALLVPHILDSWISLRLISQGLHISKFYYLPSHIYLTEDTAHTADYHHPSLSPGLPAHPSSSHEAALITQIRGFSEPRQPDSPSRQDTIRSTIAETGSSEHHGVGTVTCKDLDGNEYEIQDPVKVLKTRLMFKLLTLLNAGCDPNVTDSAGLSPSDYARRDGLWTQWFWALEQSGYVYEVRDDRWIKKAD